MHVPDTGIEYAEQVRVRAAQIQEQHDHSVVDVDEVIVRLRGEPLVRDTHVATGIGKVARVCADACSDGQICITEYGCVPPLHSGSGPEATKCAFSSSLALDLQCDPICIRAACDSTTTGEYVCFCEPECAMAEPSG